MRSPFSFTNRRAAARLGILVLALAVIGVATAVWGVSPLRDALDQVGDAGWPGVVAFIGLYALATVLLVPGSITTATAGAIYGTVAGAAVAVVGATLGATAAYAISRGAGRRAVEDLLANRGAEIDAWVAERQFRSILVLRLLPVVPFSLFNYAAGLSPVRPLPYVAGTALGMIPAALLVAGVGSSIRQPTSPAFAAFVLAFAAMVLISGRLARRWTSPAPAIANDAPPAPAAGDGTDAGTPPPGQGDGDGD